MNLVIKNTSSYINSRGEFAPFYEMVDIDVPQVKVAEPIAKNSQVVLRGEQTETIMKAAAAFERIGNHAAALELRKELANGNGMAQQFPVEPFFSTLAK